jgi:hypothetical protein
MILAAILLTVLKQGYFQALFTGFLAISSTTSRGVIASTALRIVLRWSTFFLLALLLGSGLLYLLGPFVFHRFIHLEYLLVLFLGIIQLLNLSAKHEHFRNFLYNKRWLYSMAMLQGFSALGNMGSIYAIDAEISFPIVLMACLSYGLAYCFTSSLFAVLIGILTNTGQKARSALVVLLSILGIIIGIIHFFTGLI